MKQTLALVLLVFGIVGCESYQMIDEYDGAITKKITGEFGCFWVRNKVLKNKYTTGFTLGLIDLSAGQMKFEEALVSYLKSNNKDCFITRTNEVSIMGNTQGIEMFYQCKE